MAESSTNSRLAIDLFIELDRLAGVPLHRQVVRSIRAGIRAGTLALGASLPPSRVLARDLGVSRGVIVSAYEQLVAEGYLTSQVGGYTQVAIGAEADPAPPRPDPAPPSTIDFGYGRADVSTFPRVAWLRSIRRVLTEAPNDRFGYPSGRGVVELRHALAEYLNRVRGTSAKADNIVISNGYAQGSALVVQTLARSGARRLAVEDPSSNDDVVPLARSYGLEVVGVPVGDDGVDVTALAASGADAVVLTPSHQWPTGAVLPAESRAAVLRWAKQQGALVIEDDYDAEYRYDRAPVGAMQGLAPDQVVYCGSASKTLAPGLRLGWLVLPADLADAVADAKVSADRGSPVLDQLTFADFLTEGEFDRHLRRMRPTYRKRRDALLAALARHLPDLRPAGIAAGLHLVAWLPDGLAEAPVVDAAARRGLGVHGVAGYRMARTGPAGLIFGYATLNERTIDTGIALLADVINEVATPR